MTDNDNAAFLARELLKGKPAAWPWKSRGMWWIGKALRREGLAYLDTWNGVGEIVEAMRKRGFDTVLFSSPKPTAEFWSSFMQRSRRTAETLPLAIQAAAVEALNGERKCG